MFTTTPPRSSIGSTDGQTITSAAAAAVQRKRARPDQLLFQASSPAIVVQNSQCQEVNNDIRITNDTSSSSSSLAGNPTVLVSPFIDHKISSTTNVGGMISSSSSPMTTRLEPLIECAPSEELPEPSMPNNVDYYNSDYLHQPPMKRVKVVDQGGTNNDEELKDIVIPLEECHDDDQEMTCNSSDHSRSSKSSNSLMKQLMKSGNASSLTTVSNRNNDAACSTDGTICCHVCGGHGDSETGHGATNNAGGSTSGNSSSNIGGSCAKSRSIASYFQVTKKQSSSSKLPSQPSSTLKSSSSRKPSSQHTTITPTNTTNQHLLPPCRYCDRPTCNNNPSCIKQCEECQHNFCSFCCKVNYDGMYEKTVCFECDELLMLSHCCDRMEL
mmetsp:Transcript_11584/g.19187  ORF Transcript_11584/g.19187 Transcript_11584/m.19187 type:complete len:384 (+) Transcript_11584:226-1377(+)